MCRLLSVRSGRGFEMGEHLEAFAEIARNSREYQGHGWGCAWLEDGGWRTYRNLAPVWEDPWRPPRRTTLMLAHARSAFRNEGISVENNMPFSDGERVFIFNGEIRGVRIRERGRIGAEKVFNFIKRFDQGHLTQALERGLGVIERRSRYVRAMNLVIADTSARIWVASRFNEDPDYFRMCRATIGGALVISSKPYRGFARGARWTPIPNGSVAAC